ncbi:MAG TPA: hypothetical protein VHY91_03020 [Pirellulales bacterium]|jgi:arginine repressor|nr:hypothetical protein [Pirellulales bacterium]
MAKAPAAKHRKKTTHTKASHAHGGVNKAQAIRDAAKKLGKKVRPKDIIAALAAEGINVSSPQVSSTLKAAGYRRTRRTGRSATTGSHAGGKSTEVSLEHLLAAKALANKLGSVEAAKKAIDVLTRLA